ncbi:hypothetical protein OESDEN_11277, partial [Oesophagostomum dentatum]
MDELDSLLTNPRDTTSITSLEIMKKKLILGYVSGSLPLPNPEEQQSIEAIEEAVRLHYVRGDVTRPQREEDDHSKCQLILHCVDNSGTFGDRGIFAALRAKDPSIADRYELISRMGDLRIGDAHLISDVKELRDSPETEEQPSTSSRTDEAVILFVGQSSKRRDEIRLATLEHCFARIGEYARHNDASILQKRKNSLPHLRVDEAVILFVGQSSKRRDEIRLATLEHCFARIGEYARHNDASVHMARIGYGTSLSWYTVERLIRKYISDHGVPTYIYYFAKPHRPPPALAQPAAPPVPKKRPNPSPRGPSKIAKAKIDSGDVVDDDEEEEMEEDEEESDSSSASSSASEHDWSEESDEDEEEEGSDDEDEDEDESPDEEITDEELEDLKIKRRRRSSRTTVRRQPSKRKTSER